jgi:hypothetical protein
MKLQNYRIRTGETLAELERSVKAIIAGGWIPHGDALSYYDRKKSRQIFYQVMVIEKVKI